MGRRRHAVTRRRVRIIRVETDAVGVAVCVVRALALRQRRAVRNVQWIDRPNYEVDPSLESEFRTAARKYWPGVEDRQLIPGYAGIRPKVEANDFIIHKYQNYLIMLVMCFLRHNKAFHSKNLKTTLKIR